MIFNVEQEALLRLLERPPINPLTQSSASSGAPYFEKLRSWSGDDDDSVFTASTAGFSDSDSEDNSLERRVSFAEDLVTEEWTRPYTPKQDLESLYYSTEQTQKYVAPSTNST
jgi:hypothetical protein